MNRPRHPRAGGECPWYRVPFVWLLIAIPVTAVVVGLAGLAVAIRTDDGLVVDDYYEQGLRINRVLVRDRRARDLGLGARGEATPATRTLILRLRAHGSIPNAGAYTLRFLHATRGGQDRSVTLRRGADGAYRGGWPALAPGRWYLELGTDEWRLVGSLVIPGATRFALRPPDDG